MPNKHRLIGILAIVAATLTALVLYGRLPDPMPTHWNPAGDVDGWLPKPWGVSVLPLSMIGSWLLFEVVFRVSPKGFRPDTSRHVVGVVHSSLQVPLQIKHRKASALIVPFAVSGIGLPGHARRHPVNTAS